MRSGLQIHHVGLQGTPREVAIQADRELTIQKSYYLEVFLYGDYASEVVVSSIQHQFKPPQLHIRSPGFKSAWYSSNPGKKIKNKKIHPSATQVGSLIENPDASNFIQGVPCDSCPRADEGSYHSDF